MSHIQSLSFQTLKSQALVDSHLWPKVHAMINAAYIAPPEATNWPLPSHFMRIYPDPEEAARQVLKKTKDSGVFVLVFDEQTCNAGSEEKVLVGCGALMPILDITGEMDALVRAVEASEGLPVWEYNYVSTATAYRGRGIAKALVYHLEKLIVKRTGGGRVHLIVRTIEELSGQFWRKLGYQSLPGGNSVLPKGFTHMPGYNGLERDVLLWCGDKWVGP